jgi:hypothetical protein
MKYNVKQAVSGIQGEMDKASKNQVFSRALGGLASGIEGVATQKYNQDRYNTLTKPAGPNGPGGPLAQQKSLFEDMAKSDDKFERLLGKENLAKLSVFQAGLTPANMGTFGKDYADQMGGKSMFEPLFELERANRIAEGYGAKTAATEALSRKLDNIATPQANRSGGNGYMNGLFDTGRSVMGDMWSNFGQGSSPGMIDFSGSDVDLGY